MTGNKHQTPVDSTRGQKRAARDRYKLPVSLYKKAIFLTFSYGDFEIVIPDRSGTWQELRTYKNEKCACVPFRLHFHNAVISGAHNSYLWKSQEIIIPSKQIPTNQK